MSVTWVGLWSTGIMKENMFHHEASDCYKQKIEDRDSYKHIILHDTLVKLQRLNNLLLFVGLMVHARRTYLYFIANEPGVKISSISSSSSTLSSLSSSSSSSSSSTITILLLT